MSILKSTKSGKKYIEFQQDLRWFAERALELSKPLLKHKMYTREVRYTVPTYSKKTGKLGQDERWFRFHIEWPVDVFISEFKNQLLNDLKDTDFELEDVWIPKSHVME